MLITPRKEIWTVLVEGEVFARCFQFDILASKAFIKTNNIQSENSATSLYWLSLMK